MGSDIDAIMAALIDEKRVVASISRENTMLREENDKLNRELAEVDALNTRIVDMTATATAHVEERDQLKAELYEARRRLDILCSPPTDAIEKALHAARTERRRIERLVDKEREAFISAITGMGQHSSAQKRVPSQDVFGILDRLLAAIEEPTP